MRIALIILLVVLVVSYAAWKISTNRANKQSPSA